MIEIMRLLVLETSTPRGSLALFESGELIASKTFQAHRGHNSTLYAPLQELLGSEPLASGVNRIVVGTGPGSYTGVRISIAIADALALSLGAELFGVSSFLGPLGMATGVQDYAIAGDARRGQWYCASVKAGQLNTPIVPVDRATFETEVGQSLADSRTVITFDQEAPMPEVTVTQPCAVKLGEWWLREASRCPGILPIEPMYLAAPFITKSKKLGKV